MNPQTVLTIMAGTGNLEKTKSAVADGADPKSDCSLALRLAAENGHSGCVEFLIPLSEPKSLSSKALQIAASNGHPECVKLLIPVSEPKQKESAALSQAAMNGQTECVRLLIPVSDPKADDSIALQYASANGHIDCVRLLLPVSDPESAKRHVGSEVAVLIDSIIQEDRLRATHIAPETKATRAGL